MKVYVYVKHKANPQISGAGTQEGDVIFIYPIVKDQGKLTLKTYIPIVMELNIPCGQGQVPDMDFTINESRSMWQCVKCPFNDVIDCDARKYTSAKWGTGDILNPPRITKARRHSVNYGLLLSDASETLVKKQNKTDLEKALVFTNAKNNQQTKAIIEEK